MLALCRIGTRVYPTVARRVEVDACDKTPDFCYWRPWAGELVEGRFWTTGDLTELRESFLERGIVPKVSLTGKMMDIKKLTINWHAKTIIQKVPEEWARLQHFMKYFGLPYKGQGLPACTQEVLLALTSIKRKQFSTATKEALMEKQHHSCFICGSELDKSCQIDHITPLCEGVAETVNDLSNLRLLCPQTSRSSPGVPRT